MVRRFKVSKKTSKRIFRKSADKTHYKNIAPAPMRGGFRI